MESLNLTLDLASSLVPSHYPPNSSRGSSHNSTHHPGPSHVFPGAAELEAFHHWYKNWHGYIASLVCVFGIVANVLNIIVLTRRNMVSATNCILTWLAVSDGLTMAAYLPFALRFYVLYGTEQSAVRNSLPAAEFMLVYACFSVVVHSVSIWLTVTLAVFRYVSVKYPRQGAQWCSLPRAKLAVLLVNLVTLLVCSPNFVSITVRDEVLSSSSSQHLSSDSHYSSSSVEELVSTSKLDYSPVDEERLLLPTDDERFSSHGLQNASPYEDLSSSSKLHNLPLDTSASSKLHKSSPDLSSQKKLQNSSHGPSSYEPQKLPLDGDLSLPRQPQNSPHDLSSYRLQQSSSNSDILPSLSQPQNPLLPQLVSLSPEPPMTTDHSPKDCVIFNVRFKADSVTHVLLTTSNFWIQAVLVKLIPCTGLTILSVLLVRTMRAAERRRQVLRGSSLRANESGSSSFIAGLRSISSFASGLRNLDPSTSSITATAGNRRNQNTNRTTRMLLVVVALFLLTELPQGILNLLSSLLREEFVFEVYDKLGDLLDVLALINNGINFILYCAMSKQFRDTFIVVVRMYGGPCVRGVWRRMGRGGRGGVPSGHAFTPIGQNTRSTIET